MGKVSAADPNFVPHSKLNVTVSRIMVKLLCPLSAQDVGLCAVAEATKKLGHGRGEGG